jgi:hypothetical protein
MSAATAFDAPIQFNVHDLAEMVVPTTVMVVTGSYIFFLSGKTAGLEEVEPTC